MNLKVVNPKKVIFDQEVSEVVLPVVGEQITVLDFHHPFVCCLEKGNISITETGQGKVMGNVHNFAISEGVARMSNNELVIMLEAHR